MGILIIAPPSLIYAGKFIQENVFFGTDPRFLSKIALHTAENRTISNGYVTQTGEKKQFDVKNQMIEYSWEQNLFKLKLFQSAIYKQSTGWKFCTIAIQ